MKQNGVASSLPKGFAAGGTYCGVCRSRVKLDLALLTSTTDCVIVMDTPHETTGYTGKAVLLHHGVALPDGARGREITTEICDAAAYYLQCHAGDVQFFAYGMDGQFFRPSLVVQSLQNVLANLDTVRNGTVDKVIDTIGDVTKGAVTLAGGKAKMCAVAADGLRNQLGICLVTTDCLAGAAQIEKAITQCKSTVDLHDYVLLVMANGAAKEAVTEAELTQGIEQVLLDVGFQKVLQDVI